MMLTFSATHFVVKGLWFFKSDESHFYISLLFEMFHDINELILTKKWFFKKLIIDFVFLKE